MTDFSKLSKAQLVAMLEKQSAAPEAPPEAPSAPAASVDVTALMSAIVASQQAQSHAASKPEERTYKVINAKAQALGFECRDDKTGAMRQYSLPKQGDFALLPKGQIEDLQQRFPALFTEGYVAVPDLLAMNANHILDFAAFCEQTAENEIEARIEAITDPGTLWALFNHIENQRFVTTDAQGQPLSTGKDRDRMFVVEEIALSPKLNRIETAVKRRLEALTGTKVNLDGK
jgi:hypothetical protein